ncbi:hypothetical protein NVP2117O_46 [Vibrio phage 2.117.O._10N.261.45.E9]|nr:hypothetical protein NVP1117O_46 [Vibrio phage 1.117.O._10N.261.45.E9]AUR95447.1 hypothetical protein NVP1207B_40 [Vibrio phage 1.207.B._10N.222.51.C2]AUS02338.1 hypothetical protein NVP2117O_46 [Vibrio phage 2.117.O._10N.261.45.E9]
MQIHLADLRRAKHCSSGARKFFAAHGLDWQEFIKNGLPEEDFLNTGNRLAIDMVELAWAERRKNKR